MERKFKVPRIIGTIWKILAWIVLIAGILASIGMLLTSIFGGGMMEQFGPRQGRMPWAPWAFGVMGGIAGFIVSLIATIMYSLALYAVGELIYLLLAVEENTRLAAQWIRTHSAPAAYPPPPPPVPQS
ncbi:MAG: hypothetical protein ACE5OS_14365 [Anaerolineae bacterium]